MSDSVVWGAIALLCSGLLLYDARQCLRSGTFQFGCSDGILFQLAHRREHPLLYWLLVFFYLSVGLMGFGVGASLLWNAL